MAIKILTAFLTLIIDLGFGFAVFFVLLLALNGYSETVANYGIVAYLVMAALFTLLTIFGATLLAGRLLKAGKSAIAAAVIAVLAGSGLGSFLIIVSGFVAVGLAEILRTA